MGRDPELELLRHALTSAVEGRSSYLLVVGEPGIGKTALLDALAGDATARGMRVLCATGLPTEISVDGGAVDMLAAQVAAERGRRAGEATTGPQSLLELLASLEGATLVLADDLQWWDAGSVAALVFATRRLGPDPVAIVAACRPEALDDRGLASFPTVAVGPVARALAADVVRGAVPPTADDVARAVWTGVAGNTLALLEVAARLSPAQREGRARLPEDLPVGPSVAQRWAEDVVRLPAPARRALTVLAVVADDDCMDAVLLASGSTLDDLLPAEACRVVLLDGRPRFRHPLARLAVLTSADPAEVRLVHGRCAEALGLLPPTAVRVHRRARHRAASLSGPDAETARLLREDAGLLREGGALASAVDVLELAAAAEPDPSTAADVLAVAARLALDDFDDENAARLASEGIARGPVGAACGRLLQVRGLATSRVVDTGVGSDMIWEALDLLDGDERRSAVCDLLFAMDLTAGRDSAVGELVDQLGDLSGLAPLSRLVVAHSADHAGTDPDAREDMAAALVEVAPGDAVSSGWATETVLNASLDLGLDVSGPHLAAVTTALLTSGEPRRRLDGLGQDMLVAYWDGRWGALVDAADETAELCAALGRADLYSDAVRAQVLSRRGDAAGLETAVTRARAVMGAAGMEFWTGALPGEEAALALTLGRTERAAALLSQEQFQVLARLVPHTIYADHLVSFVEVLADLERVDAARENLHLLDSLLGPTTSTLGDGMRLRAQAAVAEDADVHDLLDAAAALVDEGVDCFGSAMVRLRHARWLRRHRRKGEARDRLLVALDVFQRLGCSPWEQRCRDELAAVGHEAPRHGRDDASGALTPQERRVADAVAEGCSNDEVAHRLFLSPKTVEVHLTHVYRKLGLRSRSELVRRWTTTA